MTASFFNPAKPISIDLSGVKRFNWKWALQRSPILALGIDSSYNVAKFIGLDGSPLIIQIVTGVTFDLIFVGLIALADQFRSGKRSSTYLFWGINILAMFVAAVLGTLAHSSGLYMKVSLESFTRGAAYPILGLLYNLYYHMVTGEAMEQERQEQERQRKELEANPFICEYCNARFSTIKRRNGHMARCPERAQQNPSTA